MTSVRKIKALAKPSRRPSIIVRIKRAAYRITQCKPSPPAEPSPWGTTESDAVEILAHRGVPFQHIMRMMTSLPQGAWRMDPAPQQGEKA